MIDLNNIKTQIKSLLDAANTITASTDLSGNMSTRIQKVLTVHPQKVPPQASFYPYVTSFIENKDISQDTMAISLAKGKRFAKVTVSIVSACFHSPITSNLDDPTEKDINYVMESIEQILRDDTTLNGACKWHLPQKVDYFDVFKGDAPFLKYGELKIIANIQY